MNSDQSGSESMGVSVVAGAVSTSAPPTSPGVLPRTGAPANPTAELLSSRFGSAVQRVDVMWGETTVFVARDSVHAVIRWLHDVEHYEYLVDVTAVEYREAGRPLEVVWHLRSLSQRRFLRVKVELPARGTLSVPSVIDIYSGANWLERECFDMFGIRFDGHPDLRRLLMWENYREGHPLRKDFPLRGRFSRSEQLKQALAADPEARYSMEELSIAEAFDDLPEDMRRRLSDAASHGALVEGE